MVACGIDGASTRHYKTRSVRRSGGEYTPQKRTSGETCVCVCMCVRVRVRARGGGRGGAHLRESACARQRVRQSKQEQECKQDGAAADMELTSGETMLAPS